jgi:DNA polymerase III subunit delta'
VSPWDEVLGQPAAVDALRAALRADEVGHAWLLAGPRAAGQAELVRALAMALNCPDAAAPDEPCGSCSTCERIARGVHPASDTFEPEGAFHVVDAVRGTWTPEATRSLTEGRRRVLRIVAADRMNEGAQNAFLKILEEPPASLVWVLDAEDESALLDTIVSRCRRLDLVPWRPEVLRELAGRIGIADDQQQALARVALGSPQRLRDLADPDVAEARWRHLAIVDRLATEGPGCVVPLAKELNRWARSRVEPLKEQHQVELEQAALDGADRGAGDVAVLGLELRRVVADVLQHRPQVLQVEQKQAPVVGDLEHQAKHALLYVVQAKHATKQQRPHVRDGRTHRKAQVSVDVPELDRAAGELRLQL